MTSAQEKRDLAYENGGFIPDAAAYGDRWPRAAAAFRAARRCDLDVSYGDHPRAAYDLFWPEGTPKGLMVFVHGGYWKARAKSDWSHFAAGGLERGYAVVLPGYPLAPEVRISEITQHIARAITAAAAQVAGPIALTGHSAGGHLVARMAMPGVLTEDVAGRIFTSVPISPVSDLRPLVDLSMNAELRLDAVEAAAESPILGLPLPHIAVTPIVGAEERPVFLDQARWLAEAWGTPQIILPGRHHFDVIDALMDPDSRMMRALLG
ncbi:alpha/beta hydrolase [Litoreibacter roseus]|uniref:Esterase n=1 Tax=Litoreibacter roseus TaxID=2601869 RepID=A0A6N6JFU8_9RHOB|nr:alpha/beta hydrolase [Litoreibacter roseus]GFE65231.1 esterase [Litoreibacter roseus]